MPKIRGIKPETWTDENFVELTPLARLLFIGLWNYACDNGHVEDKSKQIKMRLLPADDCSANALLDELAEHGRIDRKSGWITIPTLTEHQRIDKRWFVTCEKPGCEKPKAKNADPQREPRSGHDEATTRPQRDPAVASRGPRDDVDVDVDLMVTRGDVDTSEADTSEASKPPALFEAPRPDVDSICDHLADAIEANGCKRPTITTKWRQAARLMLDKDGRTTEEVHGAIEWSQRDEFWRANILSLPTLREKYDQLRLQAKRKSGSTSRSEEWRSMQERQMARAIEREREMGIQR